MKRPVRLGWRSGTVGAKIDECDQCGRVCTHRLVRSYRWLEVGPIGIVPLGIRHGMECSACWAWTPIPWRDVRRATRTRSLPLPGRRRPATEAAVAAGGAAPDLDRVLPSGGLDSASAYLGAWAVVVAILVGLAAQPRGTEGAHESGGTCLVVVGLSAGQPVPTPPLTVSETLCILPHNFEPLVKVPLSGFAPSATVPPYSVVEAQAAAPCSTAFEGAFGSPPPAGVVPLVTGADPRDWARGDRFTWCAAADPAQPWPTDAFPR